MGPTAILSMTSLHILHFFGKLKLVSKPETIFSIMTKVKVAKGIHKQMSKVFDILSSKLIAIWIEQKSKQMFQALFFSLFLIDLGHSKLFVFIFVNL